MDGGCGHDDGIVPDLHEQAGIDELVGEKLVPFIGENGLELDRAGGGIDLVVNSQEVAIGKFLLLFPVKGLDRKARAAFELGEYLWQVVFGNGENHGDWL